MSVSQSRPPLGQHLKGNQTTVNRRPLPCFHLLKSPGKKNSIDRFLWFGHEPVVSWGKQATKERFPKSKPIPGPKDQGFPHTREQQPKENNPNKKRVNPQPWSTTGRTTGPYQPGGGPRSLSPPRCRRSTQGFGDAHSRRDGTQILSQSGTG